MAKAADLTPAPKKRRGVGEWRPQFLAALRNSGNVRAACQAAGVSRQLAYSHKEASKEFAAQWAEAMEDAIDVLEAVASQRAKASSDTLLIFLLKAHRPDKYADRLNVLHTIRREAERLAAETGEPFDTLLAEMERLAGVHH